MRGIVRHCENGYGFITSGEHRRLFFLFKSIITPNEVNVCYALKDEEVEFEMGTSRNSRPAAVNVQILSKREPLEIYSYREQGTVWQCNPESAVITRPFAENGIMKRDWCYGFETRSKAGNLKFVEGQCFEYSVRPPPPGLRMFECYDAIELIPVEPEPTLEDSWLDGETAQQ
jgi:cold shock CspA family protein